MRMILSGTRSRGLGAVRKALWALFGALAALCPSAATASGREVDGLDGARYQAGQTDAGSGGLSLLSGADGVPADVVRAGRPGVTPRAGTNPPSAYLYFRVANGAVRPTPEPIYVVVEYFDEVVGSSGLRLDYDSAGGDDLAGRYHAADDQAGGAMVDTKRWQTAAFLLRQPGFARRENVGADFRLSGGRPIIHSVRLTRTRPTNWDRLATLPPATLLSLIHI